MGTTTPKNHYKTLAAILTFAVILLGIFTIKFYNEVSLNKTALLTEKNLIAGELQDILDNYNEEILSSQYLQDELQEAKERTAKLIRELEEAKATSEVLERFRREIQVLRSERIVLLRKTDSLEALNRKLSDEKKQTEAAYALTLQERNFLAQRNAQLQNNLEAGARLTVSNLEADGMIERRSGRLVETKKARKVEKIQVCFIVNENPLAKSGRRLLFVQIVDPKNYVLGERNVLQVENQELLYSSQTVIPYTKQETEQCVLVDVGERELMDGMYRVSVFENDRLLQKRLLRLD